MRNANERLHLKCKLLNEIMRLVVSVFHTGRPSKEAITSIRALHTETDRQTVFIDPQGKFKQKLIQQFLGLSLLILVICVIIFLHS